MWLQSKISDDQNLKSCMHLGGVSDGFLSSYREDSLMKKKAFQLYSSDKVETSIKWWQVQWWQWFYII